MNDQSHNAPWQSVNKAQVEQLWQYYKAYQPFYAIIGAVIEGLQPGDIYFHHSSGGFWIIHQFGFSQCVVSKNESSVSQPPSQQFYLDISNAINGQFELSLPAKVRLFAVNESFACALSGDNMQPSERVQWDFAGEQTKSVGKSKYVSLITENDIDGINHALGIELSSRFWPSKDVFLSHGFGCVSKSDDGEIQGVCYSAAISGNCAEVDIITAEKFRGKGIAKNTALAFIDTCKIRKIEPKWDCFTNNDASMVLATRLGFKPRTPYVFYTCQAVIHDSIIENTKEVNYAR